MRPGAPLASGLALDDLTATVAGRPDGILLPKCLPEDVRTLDHYLSALEVAAGAPQGPVLYTGKVEKFY